MCFHIRVRCKKVQLELQFYNDDTSMTYYKSFKFSRQYCIDINTNLTNHSNNIICDIKYELHCPPAAHLNLVVPISPSFEYVISFVYF